jgi:ribose 1,5-bisphosphokinase PhnN
MGDVCAPGLKDRIVVRVNVADLCLRTGRMVMPKVSMKEPVRMVVVLLVLMVVLKRRLEERKR